MEDKAQSGLQHIPSGGALTLHSGRSSIFARGRRDAANSSANADYQRGVAAYNAGRFADAAASFSQAAGQGHAESQYILSTMYDAGKGVPQEDAQAARWERTAAEQGHAYAQANLSFRCYSAGDFAGAFEWCQRAADGDLAWAQYNLGLMYQKGEGVAPSDAEAAHLYRLAASQGFADAQQRLADLYYLGQGVPRNYTQAAHWYRRAAEQGNAKAQFQLGHLYDVGLGIEHDYTQYRYWTRMAAEQGHEDARREMNRRDYRDP
ncbi:MAG: tetratricopeptide repeat protein [Terracidiphilus sp.]